MNADAALAARVAELEAMFASIARTTCLSRIFRYRVRAIGTSPNIIRLRA